EEPIVYEEIIEEVQEEPTEITPEPEVELIKEELPEIPITEYREEIEPTAEELDSVEEKQPEEVLTFLDEEQPSQEEQVIEESTEKEEAIEEEETWESMYDYNQIDEEDEEE
ncbi:MAG: translation initiation factor IF-2, partial [Candidatus Heimdallarchaeaceae archaeon]